MFEDEEDEIYSHYTTPMWRHLLIFAFAVSVAVIISQMLPG